MYTHQIQCDPYVLSHPIKSFLKDSFQAVQLGYYLGEKRYILTKIAGILCTFLKVNILEIILKIFLWKIYLCHWIRYFSNKLSVQTIAKYKKICKEHNTFILNKKLFIKTLELKLNIAINIIMTFFDTRILKQNWNVKILCISITKSTLLNVSTNPPFFQHFCTLLYFPSLQILYSFWY